MKKRSLNYRVRYAFVLICCSLSVFQFACDSEGAGGTGIELVPIADTQAVLTNGYLSVDLKDSGVLHDNRISPDGILPNRRIYAGSVLGLWVAGSQNGTRSNVMSGILVGPDKFQMSPTIADGGGLFIVNKVDFLNGYEKWPSQFGAPAYPDGSPKMLGDVMGWSAFKSAATSGSSGSSFLDLNVVVNPYLFENEELKSTLFVRYTISNHSSVAIDNLHIGFGGDVDLFWSDPTNPPCGPSNHRWNHTGYNSVKDFTFTYAKPDPSDGNIPSECYGTLVGYSIVGSESANGLMASVLAHPVLTRSSEESFEAFQESKIKTPLQVLYALQGLSSEGASMINPSTGEVTTFAYTGNPLTEVGWVDTRKDVRSLQSISPITLAPGETVVTTVAIFTAVSPTFEQGYSDLASLYDLILTRRNLWDK